jgi:hypothetical protein
MRKDDGKKECECGSCHYPADHSGAPSAGETTAARVNCTHALPGCRSLMSGGLSVRLRLGVAAGAAIIGPERRPFRPERRNGVDELHRLKAVRASCWRGSVHGHENSGCKSVCKSVVVFQNLNFGCATAVPNGALPHVWNGASETGAAFKTG